MEIRGDMDDDDIDRYFAKCDDITKILEGVYGKISEIDFEDLASDLYYCIYGEGELSEILSMLYEYEGFMRDVVHVDIPVGGHRAAFDGILDILDENEFNARRLYNNFLIYNNLKSFYVLMDTFKKWLTADELNEILAIAKTSFMPFLWEKYV